MASEKTFNARFQNKRDTSANWTASNPVLLNGETIIVDTANGEVRRKTGDGVKTYTQLPFDDEVMKNLVNSKHSEIMSETQPPNLSVGDDWDRIL